MANLLYDVQWSPAVDQYYDRLNSQAQDELGLIVSWLRVDPWPDDDRKVDLSSDLGLRYAYDDGDWTINYTVRGRIIRLYGVVHREWGSSAGSGHRL